MMKVFTSNNNKNADVLTPPVFNKHKEHVLLKGQNPARRASLLSASAPALGFASAANKRRSSHATLSPRSGSSSMTFTSLPPFKREKSTEKKTATATPKSASSVASNSSYFEEIIEELSYDEETVSEELFDEEEFLEEEIMLLADRKITIRFEEYDEMQHTLCRSDYTKSEMNASWYTSSDYDKMVQKARQTIAKVEARAEKRSLSSSPKKDKKKKPKKKKSEEIKKQKETDHQNNDQDDVDHHAEDEHSVVDHEDDEKSVTETATITTKGKKALDTRGLEAWSTVGATEVRVLKESAIEAVWNEQSRQWTTGEADSERLREVSLAVTAPALQMALDRAEKDRAAVEAMLEKEKGKEGKKKRRQMLSKGKALLGKSMRVTTETVKRKTGKLVGSTTKKKDKKSPKEKKQSKGTTSDDKNDEETDIPERTTFRQPARSAIVEFEDYQLERESQSSRASIDGMSNDMSTVTDTTNQKRPGRTLLGVPIPGTSKLNKEDARQSKPSRMPSWEIGVKAGKY